MGAGCLSAIILIFSLQNVLEPKTKWGLYLAFFISPFSVSGNAMQGDEYGGYPVGSRGLVPRSTYSSGMLEVREQVSQFNPLELDLL